MATQWVNVEAIGSYFESLSDPRHTQSQTSTGRHRRHRRLCHRVRLRWPHGHPSLGHRTAATGWLSFSPLPNGIPSRDCIRRLFIASSPKPSNAASRPGSPTRSRPTTSDPDRLVAIDGKTCRGSHDARKDLGPLHIVSAWASEEGIALGQVATEAKSNEITAIPQLLEQIDLTDTMITIDAMGCQKDIVEQDRRRWRRLRDRRQGQPADAPRRRSKRSSRTHGARPGRPPVPQSTKRARTGTAASTSGRIISRRCRAISRRRRTGRG